MCNLIRSLFTKSAQLFGVQKDQHQSADGLVQEHQVLHIVLSESD